MLKIKIASIYLLVPFCLSCITAFAQPPSRQADLKLEWYRAMEERNPSKAVAIATEGIRSNTDNAAFHEFRGVAYMETRKRDLALQDFSAAIKAKPSGNRYYLRARVYWELGEFKKAGADIEQAAKLEPRAVYKITQANILLDQEETDAAIRSAQAALPLVSKEPIAHRNVITADCYHVIGRAYLNKREPKKALEFMQKSLNLAPGWQKGKSTNDQKQLLAVAKKYGNRILMEAEAYEKAGRTKEAIRDYELIVKAHPMQFDYHRSLLRAYKSDKDYEKALKLLNAMLQVDDQPDLYYKRAEVYKALGKTDLAKVDIARAQKQERMLTEPFR